MNEIRILFPNEPYARKHVDSSYEEEFNTCKLLGIKTNFYDYEELVENGILESDVNYNGSNVTLIYRGWMLKPETYELLYNLILEKTNGYFVLLNSPKQYETCHCFPYVYESIKDYTPKIVVVDEWNNINRVFDALLNINYNFFLKDYVKSVKTDKGVISYTPLISSLGLMEEIKKFVEERGSLFTKGIVIKEFVDLKKINNKTNEWRAFYYYGKLIDISNNVEGSTVSDCPPMSFVKKIGDILSDKSNFFTVDFALNDKDQWIVIETGDGGVSGLSPNCKSLSFYNKLFTDLTI